MKTKTIDDKVSDKIIERTCNQIYVEVARHGYGFYKQFETEYVRLMKENKPLLMMEAYKKIYNNFDGD